MIFNIRSQKKPTELEDARSMLLHLEDEYRKANISERDYAELKQKYTEKLRKLDKNFDKPSSEKVVVKETTNVDRSQEREDISMFLGSLEDQYSRGEINKEEYENIRNINLERLNDIIGRSRKVEEIKPEEVKQEEIKVGTEKGGIFQRLFGNSKKLEKEVPEEKVEKMSEYVELEKKPESNEVELKEGMFQIIPEEKTEPERPEEKVVKMPDWVTQEEPVKVDEEIKEMPKKKGFFKSLFGKKKEKPLEEVKEETKVEEAPEVVEEMPKEEAPKDVVKPEEPKVEEAPKEAPKEEEKRLEPGEIEEVTPEVIEKLAAQMAEDQGTEPIEEEPKESEDEEATTDAATNKLKIEIEKLKVMLDNVRDSRRSTDETIQNLSENMGEIRSLVMQTDANYKTTLSKMERMEDDVSDVKPKEITKKFNEIRDNMERNKMEMEKIEQKLNGTIEKVNEIHSTIKVIGDVENLTNLNNNIQTKLRDISEAIKYIQRIGTRTEKIFIDLSKGLEDLILLKAKQEDYDESLKNILASVDSFNVKLNDYVTKEDLNVFREDAMINKKQIDNIKKILPIADLKLPENIIKLRKEREDIEMFLESLEMQFVNNKISKGEYEDIRRSNIKKLSGMEDQLQKEWDSLSKMIKGEADEEAPKETPKPEVKERKSKKSGKKKRKRTEKGTRKEKILSDLKKLKA